MEATYGQFFLSSLQGACLASSADACLAQAPRAGTLCGAALRHSNGDSVSSGSRASSGGRRDELEAATALPRQPSAASTATAAAPEGFQKPAPPGSPEAPRGEAGASTVPGALHARSAPGGLGSGAASPSSASLGGFGLAPPPPPSGSMSVGSPVQQSVVVIDSLREAKAGDKASSSLQEEVTNCTGAQFFDDEEPLVLGAVTPRDPQHLINEAHSARGVGRLAPNGVDSDSEVDEAPAEPQRRTDARELESSETRQADVMSALETSSSRAVASTAPAVPPLPAMQAAASPGEVAVADPSNGAPSRKESGDAIVVCTRKGVRFNDEVVRPPPVNGSSTKGLPFKVCVPAPYPGVQYRRSKNLDDRYPRYAENGTEVLGVVEDDWLKVTETAWLPLKVGGAEILQRVEVPKKVETSGAPGGAFWSCCAGGNVS